MADIKWGYFRRSWTSCGKAQKFFEQNNIEMGQVVNATKEKLDADSAWDLVKNATKIYAGKGQKVVEFNPKTDDKELILKNIMGRSGNLRAPSWAVGSYYVVGYNEELYAKVFG